MAISPEGERAARRPGAFTPHSRYSGLYEL